MRIQLEKFGLVLSSRQAGREAAMAFQPTLETTAEDEDIELDFTGVFSLAPSWAEEFLRPLYERFGGRVKLLPSDNASVKATLTFLEKIRTKEGA